MNVVPTASGKAVALFSQRGKLIAANLITNDGGSIIAAGGGNIIAAGSGNIIAAGGGNLRDLKGVAFGAKY